MTEALLAGERRLLEMLASGRTLAEILEAVCLLAEATSPGALCSILLVDADGARVRFAAGPSLPGPYRAAVDGLPIGAAEGPCGVAIHTRRRMAVADTAADTGDVSAHWRHLALAHGLRSCSSTPILSLQGDVLGTIALGFHEPRLLTPEEGNVVDRLCHLASIAIERTRKEDALRRSEALLAETQRLSRTGGFVWRTGTGEITWSDETYRIFELDPAGPLTMELVRERIHPADADFFRQTVARARAEGGDLAYEHRLLLPDGSVKHLRIVAHASGGAGSGELEYVGAVMDVTDRKRAEAALDRMRADLAHVTRVTTLGQMTAAIAHEINQPLAAVVLNGNACLRWLAGDPPQVEEAREAGRRIVRDGQRAGEVIARLRALFERTGPVSEPLALPEVVRDVVALTRAEVQRAGAALRVEVDGGLPPVTGDRVQLQQLLLNLITNALEALSGVEGRPREVVVRAAPHGAGEVEVAVTDSGVGLDPEDRDRIFDAFHSGKHGGMGMGLAISRSIVEQHGGRIRAEPNGGPGATLRFTLPVRG
jgi:signal transduction histidine kinase